MSIETKAQLRAELDTLKREHIKFANRVRRETATAMTVLCMRVGPEHRSAVAMANLCTEAANIVQQSQMTQEQASGYDLADLRVDTTSASNSETGWERED